MQRGILSDIDERGARTHTHTHHKHCWYMICGGSEFAETWLLWHTPAHTHTQHPSLCAEITLLSFVKWLLSDVKWARCTAKYKTRWIGPCCLPWMALSRCCLRVWPYEHIPVYLLPRLYSSPSFILGERARKGILKCDISSNTINNVTANLAKSISHWFEVVVSYHAMHYSDSISLILLSECSEFPFQCQCCIGHNNAVQWEWR